MVMADHEREEIIVTDGGRRSGGSTAVIIVALLAVIVVLFLVFGRGMIDGAGTKTIKADVDISTPKTGG
jgi:hypothetical protein